MTRGEENPMAQLTDDDVELMRSLREAEQQAEFFGAIELEETGDVSE